MNSQKIKAKLIASLESLAAGIQDREIPEVARGIFVGVYDLKDAVRIIEELNGQWQDALAGEREAALIDRREA